MGKDTHKSDKDQKNDFDPHGFFDPLNLSKVFIEMGAQFLSNPEKFMRMQADLMNSYAELFQLMAKKVSGEAVANLVEPEKADRRFKSQTWQENPYFDFLRQAYLLTSNQVMKSVHDIEGMPPETRQKAEFYTRQIVDAFSPSNFFFTNPDVIKETLETKGENLKKGFENWMKDLDLQTGQLNIRKTDYKQFKVGENIATTEGKIVHQSDLMQLIQYTPRTEKQYAKPVLIVPPWINKYYILDLQPKNSLVKWLLDQGHAVFIVSWVNPDKRHAHKDFADYLQEGFLDNIDFVLKATGQKNLNLVSYCLGGTLSSSGLAYLKRKKQIGKIASTTFLTTLIDFERSGDLKVFIDREIVDMLEDRMEKEGYLPAEFFQSAFSLMRSNDLIWSFFVNNYLLGRDPGSFDLLYWNDDSTRLPAKMQSFYMRNMYLENRLKDKNGLTLLGEPIDVSSVTECPIYFLSAKEDHIAPWKATFDGMKLFIKNNKNVQFVLTEAGHIAGVVNAPAAEKYGYWTNTDLDKRDEDWFLTAKHHKGSWWTHWQKWLAAHSGEKKPAYAIDQNNIIEDAPGSYVKVRFKEA